MPANKIKIDNAIKKRFDKRTTKRTIRSIKVRILIVCEGTKTEPNYFKQFKTINHGIAVYDITVEGTASNTTNVVDKAIEMRNNAVGCGTIYDRVWAVFDKDSFSAQRFNTAIDKAKRNGICCAWSNEAFELWFLYHFINRITAMSRNEYKKAITKEVCKHKKYKLRKYQYQKNDPSTYHIIGECGSIENAIKWARQQAQSFTDQRYSTHNPCTLVYKLVEQLLGHDIELNNEIIAKLSE